MSRSKFKPHNSYSWEGEDMILRKLLGNRKVGFYVDVGANRPYKYSNTAHFYEKGWSGINIDASIDCIEELNKHRSRDINIHTLVGTKQNKIKYYCYEDSAYNTVFKEKVIDLRQNFGINHIGVLQMKTEPLGAILDKHLSPNQKIDFMSIDVEGVELDVLRSNIWEKYKPVCLVVEELKLSRVGDTSTSKIAKFLANFGYSAISKTPKSVIYKED